MSGSSRRCHALGIFSLSKSLLENVGRIHEILRLCVFCNGLYLSVVLILTALTNSVPANEEFFFHSTRNIIQIHCIIIYSNYGWSSSSLIF